MHMSGSLTAFWMFSNLLHLHLWPGSRACRPLIQSKRDRQVPSSSGLSTYWCSRSLLVDQTYIGSGTDKDSGVRSRLNCYDNNKNKPRFVASTATPLCTKGFSVGQHFPQPSYVFVFVSSLLASKPPFRSSFGRCSLANGLTCTLSASGLSQIWSMTAAVLTSACPRSSWVTPPTLTQNRSRPRSRQDLRHLAPTRGIATMQTRRGSLQNGWLPDLLLLPSLRTIPEILEGFAATYAVSRSKALAINGAMRLQISTRPR